MISLNRNKPQNRIDTLIGAESTIEGDIDFSGGLRVDGCVRGNVNEAGAKSGTLVLSEHGRIEGSINVSHAVINGTVQGPVSARLHRAAKQIQGDRRRALQDPGNPHGRSRGGQADLRGRGAQSVRN